MSPLTVPTADETRRFVRVHHDPFLRITTVRITAKGTCEWCGKPARFRYGSLPAYAVRPQFDLHVYCSRPCRRAYLAE